MKLIFIFCLLVTIVCLGILFLRRELPYDIVVIRVGDKILVHNKTIWNTRDLDVSFTINGEEGNAILDGRSNTAIIPVFDDLCLVELSVSRHDVKGKIMYKPHGFKGKFDRHMKKYIVFIGASIGRDWQLETLPERVSGLSDISIIFWPEYQFDKKRVVDHVMKMPVPPDFVFVKECAAYFPLDVDRKVKEILGSFHAMKKVGLHPVAVTTVPVTSQNDDEYKGRADSIHEYNRRLISSGENVFDLASFLTDKETSVKFLKSELAVADGLHLNSKAYSLMDKYFADYIEVLCSGYQEVSSDF